MNRQWRRLLPILAATAVLGGCGQLATNDQPSVFDSAVQPVVTEYSLALSCVGELIDNTGRAPMTVYIEDIDDETVPRRFRERRLSRGGAWWLHTAIGKLESDLVSSSTRVPGRKVPIDTPHVVLSGAWTQDDLGVGRKRQGVGLGNKGGGYFDSFDWGRQREISVIAGDFLSSVNGRVVHASAISLAVGGHSDGFDLRIDDGVRRLDVGIASEINEGPQFAQRRIAEAAVLVHVARAFDVDYLACIQQEWATPTRYAEQVREYESRVRKEQNRLMQQALTNAGFDPGSADGIWGQRSAQALARFQQARGLPPSGQPSAPLYGLILSQVN